MSFLKKSNIDRKRRQTAMIQAKPELLNLQKDVLKQEVKVAKKYFYQEKLEDIRKKGVNKR